MALDTHTNSTFEPIAGEHADPHPYWSEHLVTMVAASIAVLIVAAIAILMGMA